MKRAVVLLLALTVGALAGHFGYLHVMAVTPAPTALDWLERELELTPEQVAAARRLHDDWEPTFAALRDELVRERRAAKLTGNTAACVGIEENCKASTTTLVGQMCALLTPAQRQKYCALVASCVPTPPPVDPTLRQNRGTRGEPPAGR